MACYGTDRAYSDIFIPQMRQIVGPLLLEPASFEEDVKRATDLMVFKARDMRIAARVRRPGYGESYPYDFTIRSARDSGAETEFSKIVNGFGDWLFYGHSDAQSQIYRWMVIDLASFRAALIRSHSGSPSYVEKSNGDGTHFLAFDVRTFPDKPPILVASSEPVAQAA